MSKRQVISSGERYVNPFTDFGFKRIFGENPNKALLIDFLNEVLRGQSGTIKDITYLKNEHLSTTSKERKSVFDIYCTNERGEKFIVELQKAEQKFFKDRALYYATFPIREQAQRGVWNFQLKAIYIIAILDFAFEEDKDFSDKYRSDKYRSDVKLIDQVTHEVFYDKLTFIYFEMPKFKKRLDELTSQYEKWLYVLRHLNQLDSIPSKLQESIFAQLFEVAEIANFSSEQVLLYEDSLKEYRDWKNVLDTAVEKAVETGLKKGLEKGKEEGLEEGLAKGKEEGLEEGIKKGLEKGIKKGLEKGKEEGLEEGRFEVAANLLKLGIPIADISQATSLAKEEIESIVI